MNTPVEEDPPPRRPSHRSWPERFTIGTTFVSALVCFAVAAALIIGYQIARQRNVVDITNPAEAAAAETPDSAVVALPTTLAGPTTTGALDPTGAPVPPADSQATTAEPVTDPAGTVVGGTGTQPSATTPATVDIAESPVPDDTFPDADPDAQNFLITGSDNGGCVDPNSPTAGGFGEREEMGERSDTVMIIRVDPGAKRVAVLSFPRDLWVDIADRGTSRINSAYEAGNPQVLIDTIYENFGVATDHYIQVDFCAFKTLVDAVGGVSVPFEYPARDENTGLLVEEPGCVNLDGDMALAYVRSRHYEYEDPPGSGNWSTDGTSDLGRISRQQDFLRRVLSALLDKGPLDPNVAMGLIEAGTEDIVTDRDLTIAKMLEFAGVMSDVDPDSITTYQIEATGRTINGNSVLIPTIEGDNMQAVLALFTGETSLADAPVQEFEDTTTRPTVGATTLVPVSDVPGSDGVDDVDGTDGTDEAAADETDVSDGTTPGDSSTDDSIDAGADTTTDGTGDSSVGSSVPDGQPQENQFGIVPPRDMQC